MDETPYVMGNDPEPLVDGMRANPGLYLVLGRYHTDARYDYDRACAVIRQRVREDGAEVVVRSTSIDVWGSTLRFGTGTRLETVRAQRGVKGVWLTQRLIDDATISLVDLRRELAPLMQLAEETA